MRGVFVAGTTGEFASLTVDERKALCERWVEVAGDDDAGRRSRRPQLPGRRDRAGGPRPAGGRRRGRGGAARAISSRRPSIDLVDFCVPIAAEVEPLPFYYYHIPSMTGVRLAHGRVSLRGPVPHSQLARPQVLARRPGRPSGLRGRWRRTRTTFCSASTKGCSRAFAWACAGRSGPLTTSPAGTI